MTDSRLQKCSLMGLLPVFITAFCSTAPLAQDSDHEAIQVDHLVLGAADLEAGIEYMYRLTGVRAQYGGEHPGRGTHNALMSLGDGRYLEIMAPLPGAELDDFHRNLLALVDPEPIMWGLSTRDIMATSDRLSTGGFGYEEPFPMSRNRPNGAPLNWHIMLMNEPELAAAPFFIQWGTDLVHPSESSPTGCTLIALSLSDRNPDRLRRLIQLLGLPASVDSSHQSIFRATLDCPGGEIVLGG